MHRGRTRKDGGAVGSVGHHGAELHTGKAQAAVDDGHEHAGDNTRARNLEGHTLVIGNTQLMNGLGDDDAKGERREQVHGLIAGQKALHGSTGIIGSLWRGSGTQRRDHGSAHDQYDKGDERGARNAAEYARDDAGSSVSANATIKNPTANTRRAVASETPSGSSGTSISKAVELVRGMARHGPIARYTAATKNSPNLGCTRPASSRAFRQVPRR